MGGHDPDRDVMDESVGVVGAGRMGVTLASGFARAVGPERVFAVGRSAASVTRLRQAVPGARVVPVSEVTAHARLIVLCVRNLDLSTALAGLDAGLSSDHVLVTINNGLPLGELAAAVPCPVAKLVPSVGNEIGAGATLLTPGPGLTEQVVEDIVALLRAFSTPFLIDEAQGRAATDLASCGPALLAAAADSMLRAQRERGAPLPPELAEELVVHSVHAVERLIAAGTSFAEVIDRVAVPGGNTAAAVEAATEPLTGAWLDAFRATADNERAKEVPRLRSECLPE